MSEAGIVFGLADGAAEAASDGAAEAASDSGEGWRLPKDDVTPTLVKREFKLAGVFLEITTQQMLFWSYKALFWRSQGLFCMQQVRFWGPQALFPTGVVLEPANAVLEPARAAPEPTAAPGFAQHLLPKRPGHIAAQLGMKTGRPILPDEKLNPMWSPRQLKSYQPVQRMDPINGVASSEVKSFDLSMWQTSNERAFAAQFALQRSKDVS